MLDSYGRDIDYLRVSVTDRCNLRCRYCMPNGIPLVRHSDVLRYEELLRLCRRFAALGITKFKITGGEPLVRKDCAAFAAALKALPGVEQVTLTTNGVLLADRLDALRAAGIDGINVSLDTLDDGLYRAITGSPAGTADRVLEAAAASAEGGIPTKLNAVVLPETLEGCADLAAVAERRPIDVRFIERMPIGAGADAPAVPINAVLTRLRARWPDLRPTGERRGNGPAVYYQSDALQGRLGLIGAVSHQFCGGCNRVRLTSTGELKPCLCFAQGTDLRPLLRGGASDGGLEDAIRAAILQKPPAHRFGEAGAVTERRGMSQIGG